MRFSIIKTVFGKELTELLRDRRSLLVMFGIPLVLYPLLLFAVSAVSQGRVKEMAARQLHIAVRSPDGVPHLMKMLSADASSIEVVTGLSHADSDKQLKNGILDAVIDAPSNYESDALAGGNAQLTIQIDGSRLTESSMQRRLDKILDDYQQWIVDQRLAAHGLPAGLARAPTRKVDDIATGGQTFGKLLSQSLPVLLLLTGMLGAVYPAITATTSERELGTLETLLVTPATRDELLVAKAGIVLICGLLTAFLNMVSMSLVLVRAYSQMQQKIPLDVTVDPIALGLAYLAAVPTLIFFTSLVLTGGLLARNLREANSYATPMMLIPISSMLIGIADPPTTRGLLVTPVANTTIIIRDVLTGHANAGDFVLAFASSCLYAGLVLSLAGRLFTNEQLVNPAWEPISLKFFSRRKRQGPRRFPAIDEALALFCISLLLNFYIAPSWINLNFLALVAAVEVLLIAAPALIFGWLGRYRWREVFSLRRPTADALIAGACIGAGAVPVVAALDWLQVRLRFLPPNQSDMEGMTRLLSPALLSHPWLAPILIGVLAGVCEELLFRGPIQTALLRRFSPSAAFITGGFLFAAAHFDISGLPLRMALGVVLGWLVWQTASIFPAMLAHATYDALTTGWAAREIHQSSADASTPPPFALIAAGAVLLIIGVVLARLRRSSSQSPA